MSTFKGIINVSLVEAGFKVVSHWYLEPEGLHRMYPDSSALCSQGCGQVGSKFHTWSCAKVWQFWIRAHLLKEKYGFFFFFSESYLPK